MTEVPISTADALYLLQDVKTVATIYSTELGQYKQNYTREYIEKLIRFSNAYLSYGRLKELGYGMVCRLIDGYLYISTNPFKWAEIEEDYVEACGLAVRD